MCRPFVGAAGLFDSYGSQALGILSNSSYTLLARESSRSGSSIGVCAFQSRATARLRRIPATRLA